MSGSKPAVDNDGARISWGELFRLGYAGAYIVLDAKFSALYFSDSTVVRIHVCALCFRVTKKTLPAFCRLWRARSPPSTTTRLACRWRIARRFSRTNSNSKTTATKIVTKVRAHAFSFFPSCSVVLLGTGVAQFAFLIKNKGKFQQFLKKFMFLNVILCLGSTIFFFPQPNKIIKIFQHF